ncbi:uncharacterized protein LOC8074048 isoform X2 [Sorghum bicolor]|uniref:uncharacterized protein LOC8074048 isoform X2 n=1 Tax=Sorghum bicolor TaxID=4558 RepID=UPI000B424688|nr:uncharacterized protein LOC8074048 isoform X2 [Sorghum bicolor]|eukprot:XP_002443792.2 uncharacterized protein LOC8074048 isoform X2 [Sorghum bicolor]
MTTTMAMAAATSAAAAVSTSHPYPLLQPTSNRTFVSFPRRQLPATSLSLALPLPSQLSLRGLPLAPAPAANPKYHNAKVDAGDEDVAGEELLRRFNWQVSRAGVTEEVRRRRRHEDARDKRKRKARSAARRYRRRETSYTAQQQKAQCVPSGSNAASAVSRV